MSVLKSLSGLSRALALCCRDSGQVPLSVCLFNGFIAASAWKILFSAGYPGCPDCPGCLGCPVCPGWLCMTTFSGIFIRSGGLVLAVVVAEGLFRLLLSFLSVSIWKDVMLSSSEWPRSSSSGMPEVSMFSSSSMAFDVSRTASSPSDVNSVKWGSQACTTPTRVFLAFFIVWL